MCIRDSSQVITNLVDNAAKYGGGQTIVRVHLQDTDALLAVEDCGPGVSREERTVIFDRFSRGSAGGRRGHGTGSGLGLALVAEHVGLHGGAVWVEDRLDGQHGARFVARLPLGDPADLEDDLR